MVQHLSETAGTHHDSTANNNDGTPNGGVTQNAFHAKLDGRDQFDGIDDFIDFGTSSSITNQITFEAWIKPDLTSPPEYWNILSARASDGSTIPYQFYLLQTSGYIGFASSASLVDSGQLVSGNWQHVAITVDDSSSTVHFYLDGVQVATETGNFGSDVSTAITELAAFNDDHHFGGFLDEVRLSNTVRDGCWIKTSYENHNDPSSFVQVGTVRALAGFQSEITVKARNIGGPNLEDTGIIKVDGNNIDAPQVYNWIEGSEHDLEALSPVIVDSVRYVFSHWSIDGDDPTQTYVTPTDDETVTAWYVETPEYYLKINSRYDTPIGQGWYEKDTLANFSLRDGLHMYGRRVVDFPNGTRATAFRYRIDADPWQDGYNGSTTMSEDRTVTIDWQTILLNSTVIIDTDPRYWGGKEIKVDGTEYDTELPDYPSFSWINTTIHEIEALNVEESSVNRFVWDYWEDDRLGDGQPPAQVSDPNPRTYITPDPDGDIILKAIYKEQFYLTVNSDHGDPQGEGWWDGNSEASFNVTSPSAESNGTRFITTGYSLDDAPIVNSTSGTVIMDGPHSVTFFWNITQYYLTVNTAYGFAFGEGWYNEGDFPVFRIDPEFVEEDGVRHVFQGWTEDYLDGANPAGANQIVMDRAKTVTALWRDRYFIEVISPHGSPTISSWPFEGQNFTTSVTSPDGDYVVEGYKVDNSSLQSGSSYTFVNVQEPHTIEYIWKSQTDTETFTMALQTNPSNKGAISVGGTAFSDGQTVTTPPATYSITGTPEKDFSFLRWDTSGGVSVSDRNSATTTCTIAGDGTLKLVQQETQSPQPPGEWGGPESITQRCIIATAAYGSTMAPEVVHMRHVRDNMIGSTPIGNILVSGFNTFYYSWSPPVAQWIADSEGLRTTFRVLLLPISAAVHSAELVYTTISPFNPTTASVTAFLLAAAISIGAYIIAPIFTGITIYRKKYASHT
jgi:hypothetical protein